MKKLILTLATVTLLSSNVFANTDILSMSSNYNLSLSPRYTSISSVDNNLEISNDKALVDGVTRTRPSYTAKIYVELQRKNSSWSTLRAWTKSGKSVAVVSDDQVIAKGYSYRLKTTHYALDSNGNVVESVVKYSSTVSYK